MVEKRPYPGDSASPNDPKRVKSTQGIPTNAQDALAKAKAAVEEKAAALRARAAALKGATSNGTNGTTASSTPPPAAPLSGADRLAAMKARMAALKSGNAPPPSSNAPPVQSPAVANNDERRLDPSESRGPKFATTLGNRRTESPLNAVRPHSSALAQNQKDKDEEVLENPYFDPKAVRTQRTRLSRGLLFSERGKYLDQASKLRERSRLELIKQKLAQKNRQAKLEENSERAFLVTAPPEEEEVEWWDEGLLEEKTYNCIDNPSKVKIDTNDSIITSYVQHPVLLRAPQDQLLVPVKPIMLTAKEMAKARRMRRQEEHKEEQAKIRLGIVPVPPPKIKRGNMMRVMGEQAIADPTAVELLVETQIQERHDTHMASNAERQLSKEQRHEKLQANQQKDAAKGLHMLVVKIPSLVNGKHRYQLDINAKQHSLTGLTIFNPTFNLVIAEGGLHSIEKYRGLLLRRIKFTENAYPTTDRSEQPSSSKKGGNKEAEAEPEFLKPTDEGGRLKDLGSNNPVLVFEGEVKNRAFRKWGSKVCWTEGEAREVLARTKLDSLWALARGLESE